MILFIPRELLKKLIFCCASSSMTPLTFITRCIEAVYDEEVKKLEDQKNDRS